MIKTCGLQRLDSHEMIKTCALRRLDSHEMMVVSCGGRNTSCHGDFILFNDTFGARRVIYEGRAVVKVQRDLVEGRGRPGAMPMRWVKTESSIRT